MTILDTLSRHNAVWRNILIMYKIKGDLYTSLKAEIVPPKEIPASITMLSLGTASYEERIRELWQYLKSDPKAEGNADQFVEKLLASSEELWPVVIADVLGIPELSEDQKIFVSSVLGEHHNYVRNSLYPDIVKYITNNTSLEGLDYRVVFLYAGALWSAGNLATVMFDGASVRDLTDVFLFYGPNDNSNCEDCKRLVNNIYTVAEILSKQLIPGKLSCLTSCRHMLIPLGSL